MSITVRTGAALKSLFDGKQEAQAEGRTVGELFESLGIKDRVCDGDDKVRRHFSVHINESEDVRLLDGLDTAVNEGDVVTILSAIAGGAETSRKVWLTFQNDLVERPIIWEVSQKFKVVTNIRQASVSKDLGLMGVEISGEADEVIRAMEYLTESGVLVEPIELDVVE
jgi:molybdopterin converting factor small subunit